MHTLQFPQTPGIHPEVKDLQLVFDLKAQKAPLTLPLASQDSNRGLVGRSPCLLSSVYAVLLSMLFT